MVEFKVLTVRDVSFKDKDDKQVEGLQLWCSCPSDAPGWRGIEIVKIWIPADSIFVNTVDSLKPGMVLDITFNRFGKPSAMEVISK